MDCHLQVLKWKEDKVPPLKELTVHIKEQSKIYTSG